MEQISKHSTIHETSMIPGQKKVSLLRSWPRIFFFYFIGLSIFFIVGFIIINLRISQKEKVKVPALIGGLYLDVHNQLLERGFKVKLDKAYSLEYPVGYILGQSLSPGEVVKSGQRIILLVNQSRSLVKTPGLVGSVESLVDHILSNIYIGNRVFKLTKGVITRIPANRSKGEILAQYPLPGTPVVPNFPISYLVSEGNENLNSLFVPPEIKGINIEIIKKMAYFFKTPLQIKKKNVVSPKKDAIVLNSRFKSTAKEITWESIAGRLTWEVSVGYFAPSNFAVSDEKELQREKKYPFQFVWLNADDIGISSGNFTMGIKTAKRHHTVDEMQYEASAYITFEKDKKIPFFLVPGQDIFFWKDHQSLEAYPVQATEIKKGKPTVALPEPIHSFIVQSVDL